LIGASLGTKFFYPKAKLSVAYKYEILGLVGICITLGILAGITPLTLLQQFTLSGSLGAIIQIGSLRMIARLVWDLYHNKEINQ
jgi:hypothetical protein